MALDYFPCYHSYLNKTAKLSDQEVGRLFRALIKYSACGEREELTGRESVAFDFISDDIDRAQLAYEEKCARNRENGKKGHSERCQSLSNGGERPRTVPNGGECPSSADKDKSKDKSNNNTPPTPSEEADGRFEIFWKVYPRKISKAAALKAFKKLDPGAGLLQTIINAVEAQKRSKQWTKDNGQFIPNPAAWLDQERWNDELSPMEDKPDASLGSFDTDDFFKASLEHSYDR